MSEKKSFLKKKLEKRPPFVYVEFWDNTGSYPFRGTWTDIEDAEPNICLAGIGGFLLYEDEDCLVISQLYSEDRDLENSLNPQEVGNVFTVLRGSVKRILHIPESVIDGE